DLGDVASVSLLAKQQVQLHRLRLAEYEEICAIREEVDRNLVYPRAALEMGLLFEKAAVAFWSAIAEQGITLNKRLQPKLEEMGTAIPDQNQEKVAEMVPQNRGDSEESSPRGRVISTDLPDHLL